MKINYKTLLQVITQTAVCMYFLTASSAVIHYIFNRFSRDNLIILKAEPGES